jgi:hypothetical protein
MEVQKQERVLSRLRLGFGWRLGSQVFLGNKDQAINYANYIFADGNHIAIFNDLRQ